MDKGKIQEVIEKQVLTVVQAVEDKIHDEISALDRLDSDAAGKDRREKKESRNPKKESRGGEEEATEGGTVKVEAVDGKGEA